jgi:hypothetical protein
MKNKASVLFRAGSQTLCLLYSKAFFKVESCTLHTYVMVPSVKIFLSLLVLILIIRYLLLCYLKTMVL